LRTRRTALKNPSPHFLLNLEGSNLVNRLEVLGIPGSIRVMTGLKFKLRLEGTGWKLQMLCELFCCASHKGWENAESSTRYAQELRLFLRDRVGLLVVGFCVNNR
jgi:hypothetical protein